MIVTPRHVLCVLGTWRDFEEVDTIVRRTAPGFERDREFSQLLPDARMTTSFEASYNRVAPTMTGEVASSPGTHRSRVRAITSNPNGAGSKCFGCDVGTNGCPSARRRSCGEERSSGACSWPSAMVEAGRGSRLGAEAIQRCRGRCESILVLGETTAHR